MKRLSMLKRFQSQNAAAQVCSWSTLPWCEGESRTLATQRPSRAAASQPQRRVRSGEAAAPLLVARPVRGH
eukprot:2976437-Pleurochrysis_carterae.AAC.1